LTLQTIQLNDDRSLYPDVQRHHGFRDDLDGFLGGTKVENGA